MLQGYHSNAQVPWLSRERVFNEILTVNIVQYTNIMHYIRVDRYRYFYSMMSKTDRAVETVYLETDKCQFAGSHVFSYLKNKHTALSG